MRWERERQKERGRERTYTALQDSILLYNSATPHYTREVEKYRVIPTSNLRDFSEFILGSKILSGKILSGYVRSVRVWQRQTGKIKVGV